MKLDRKQPYGEITGDSEGRRYEQGGTYFTVEGVEWIDPNAAPAPASKPATKTKADKAAPADSGDQVDAQLNAQ